MLITLTIVSLVVSMTFTELTSPTKTKVVPGMMFSPSGPDLSLLAPLHDGPVLQPVKPGIILRKLLVLMSMMSTDALFRSVK